MGGKKNALHMIAFLLLVIGGLNWLLLGLIQWEIGSLFGGMSGIVSRIIYILVGLSAVYELATHKKHCMECQGGGKPEKPMAPQAGQGGGGGQ